MVENGGGPGIDVFNYEVQNLSGPYGGVIVDWELPFDPDGGIDLNSVQSPVGWGFSVEQIGVPNPSMGWGGIAGWLLDDDPWNQFLDAEIIDGNSGFLTVAEAQAFLDVEHVLHWKITPDRFSDSGCTTHLPGTPGYADALPSDNLGNSVNGFISDCNWSWGFETEFGFIDIPPEEAIFPEESLIGFSLEGLTSGPLNAPYQSSWFEFPVFTGDPPIPGNPASPQLSFPTSGLSALNPNAGAPEPATALLLGIGLAGVGWSMRRKLRANPEPENES